MWNLIPHLRLPERAAEFPLCNSHRISRTRRHHGQAIEQHAVATGIAYYVGCGGDAAGHNEAGGVGPQPGRDEGKPHDAKGQEAQRVRKQDICTKDIRTENIRKDVDSHKARREKAKIALLVR